MKCDSFRFTSRGQIVIPARLRREFHIQTGTRATVLATPEGILLKPVPSDAVSRLKGILKQPPGGLSSRSGRSTKPVNKRSRKRKHTALRRVLDSFALLAFLRGEAAAEMLEQAIARIEPMLMTEVKCAEAKYIINRKDGAARWEVIAEGLPSLPIDFISATRALLQRLCRWHEQWSEVNGRHFPAPTNSSRLSTPSAFASKRGKRFGAS